MSKSFPKGMFGSELQDVMKLLDEQETASPEVESDPSEGTVPSKEELLKELMQGEYIDAIASENPAMFEFSMMMKQWEALVEDFERRDAEEAAEHQKAEGSVNENAR